mmetsp:Transcript_63813/g.177421  ORF Transcript_63813/g.177421 Transcript_63813/m.177421 type:complete len:110 (-) Transcript_63813:144-473(-)
MAPRRASTLLVAVVCSAAALCGMRVVATFVAPPAEANARALRGTPEALERAAPVAAQAAALGVAAASLPEAAHAANQGYAILQLGWAVFIIGLGPAVLFWIYFNKPELL